MAQVDSENTTSMPARAAGAISSGLAIQQRERETALHALRRLRKEASLEIERLIGLLDASDEYVATELGDDDDREAVGDDEPSLGSFDRMPDQSKSWRQGHLWELPEVDAEQDSADSEPALGSLDQHDDQQRWAEGGRRDLEQDLAESGIADLDGLLEQTACGGWQGPRGGMI